MSLYRKKPDLVSATRWFRNGDHPLDGHPDTEGEVVRYYRHPGVDSALVHHCGAVMHLHGWLDTGGYGQTVCPGDWILTDLEIGDVRRLEAKIFAMMYEPVAVQLTAPPSFTCPVCGAVSYNPNDLRHGYCGRCHDWTGPDRCRPDVG